LRGEPVLKFVERFHRRKHRHGNFNGIRCHAIKLPATGGNAKLFLTFRQFHEIFQQLQAARFLTDKLPGGGARDPRG
jgi:hypothetical protein